MSAAGASPGTLVIKIGGTVATDVGSTKQLFADLSAMVASGRRIVLVHGGGKMVSALSGRLGLQPTFREGIRITSPAEMDVVDMVLAGQVNTALVRLATAAGLRAVGLTGADGALVTGRILAPTDGIAEDTRTARPLSVDSGILNTLLDTGYLPIVATVGTGEDGGAVNINADDAAQAIAEHIPNAALCFLSDVPGVLDGEGAVIPRLDAASVEDLVHRGVARDGMAAKLRSCVTALEAGVREVLIARYHGAGDLNAILAGTEGTVVSVRSSSENGKGTGKHS